MPAGNRRHIPREKKQLLVVMANYKTPQKIAANVACRAFRLIHVRRLMVHTGHQVMKIYIGLWRVVHAAYLLLLSGCACTTAATSSKPTLRRAVNCASVPSGKFWSARRDNEGIATPPTYRTQRRPRLSREADVDVGGPQFIVGLVERTPDTYLHEIRSELWETCGITTSLLTIWKALF
ncbi:hypothetical protein C8J57DRAFT_1252120 [Mycena rebaudengoi]|nr:hypothetical protein C8J57DRAFT_1252120 [Mycena rebaudengoi]